MQSYFKSPIYFPIKYLLGSNSGEYLITNLRHVFTPRERTHNIILSLAKDSMPETLPKKSDAIQPQPQHKGLVTKSFY